MNPLNTVVFPIVRRDYVLTAIRSLRRFTPEPVSIVVVDQTTPERAFEQALQQAADVVLKCKYNYGFAQASNLGSSLARTEYLTVCNDDVIFLPGWWAGIVQTLQDHPKVLGVAPFSPNPPHWEDKEPLMPLDELGDISQVRKLIEKENGLIIDGIMHWCVTFRRQPWLELGMYDERFMPGSGEDYDALARAYQAGWRMVATSTSWVWHWWSRSKDTLAGSVVAQPQARPSWNKLSTKGFGSEGLWDPDVNQWGQDCRRTDPEVVRMPL